MHNGNTDAEYQEIKKFLLLLAKDYNITLNWDPGRMDWWRYNVNATEDFFQANVRYWKNGNDVGLFISEYGRSVFFIVVHPDLVNFIRK